MALILLPLIFSVIAWLVPSKFTRIFGLISTLCTLVLSAVTLSYFKSNEPILIDLGLRFVRFSIDSLGFTMLLLTNAVFFLVFLSNLKTELIQDKRFIALALLMQFGLLGVFTTNTILGFYLFGN